MWNIPNNDTLPQRAGHVLSALVLGLAGSGVLGHGGGGPCGLGVALTFKNLDMGGSWYGYTFGLLLVLGFMGPTRVNI